MSKEKILKTEKKEKITENKKIAKKSSNSKKKKAKLRRKKYLDYTIYVDLLAHRFNTTKIYYDGSFSIKKITFVQNLFIYETRSISSSRLFPARRTAK